MIKSIRLIVKILPYSSTALSTDSSHCKISKLFSLAMTLKASVFPQPEGPESINIFGLSVFNFSRSHLEISCCFCLLTASSDGFWGAHAANRTDKLLFGFFLPSEKLVSKSEKLWELLVSFLAFVDALGFLEKGSSKPSRSKEDCSQLLAFLCKLQKSHLTAHSY